MTPLAYWLESSLLPTPNVWKWEQGGVTQERLSTLQKVRFCAIQVFSFISGMTLLPVAAVVSLGSKIATLFSPAPKPVSTIDTPADLASALPADFGFADSLFQSSGLGTAHSATPLEGKSDWNKWLTKEHIEGHENYGELFVDILSNPQPFIYILKQMNVTAHRFSLEWAVIEPEPGRIDMKAVALYRNFIRELKNAGIEPYVTLHHFVLPEWFSGFQDPANVDLFVLHSLRMMETFPEVKQWMTFNEPGVYAFSTRLRGAYPPGGKGDVHGMGLVLRNLLLAHCKTYKEAKEKFGDKVQVGITHQWLKFEPLEGNFVERMICYFLSKMCHDCVYGFFKKGRFDFEMPFQANVHLSVCPKEFEANNAFLDFIGVQFYGFPRLKAGFNAGQTYPGHMTQNYHFGNTGLTFGATCPPGGKTLSFGPSFYPESLESCLTEAAALNKPIAITETGCDAKIQKWGEAGFSVDNETQKEYFLKIAPILHRFKDQMKAFFAWTLYRGHLEWERGDFPNLGLVRFEKDKDRVITGYEPSPAAELLRKVFNERKFLPPKERAA